ncbi:MAG: hypothetical protein WA188_11230, partial [Terriglobales bacterium]
MAGINFFDDFTALPSGIMPQLPPSFTGYLLRTSLTKSATSTLFSEGFAFSQVHFGLSAGALRCWSITVHLLPP